jgi:hypothetical protein
MLPDETPDVTQLDDLAHELADAGRLARIVSAHREQPDPGFARNLRDELAGILTGPAGGVATTPGAPEFSPTPPVPAAPAPLTPPMPPSGPFPGAGTTPAPNGSSPVPSAPTTAASLPVPMPLPKPQSLPRATPGRRGISHPFGQAPEWPPISTRAGENLPAAAAVSASIQTAGLLDAADVDEASIEAFYKWAAKARAADRTAVAVEELPSPAQVSPVVVVKVPAAKVPAAKTPAAKSPAAKIPSAKAPSPDARPSGESLPGEGRATRSRPRVHLAVPHISKKWAVAPLAACLILAVMAYGFGLFSGPTRGAATAQETISATLIRAGARSELTSYQTLQVNDEIQVGQGGHVNLTIDDSRVRLAAGADVKLVKIDLGHVAIDQLSGEVYYRVSVPAGGDYSVNTGSVSWVADGTAFDLNRSLRPDGAGDEVVALALVDGFEIEGAEIGTNLQLNEGMSATVELSEAGTANGPPVTRAISAEVLAQDWIVGNANLDADLELPMGVLVAKAHATPTATATTGQTEPPSEVPTSSPSASPTPSSTPSSSATVEPTASATPTATPKPTPTRTATPKPTAAGPVYLGGLGFAPSGNGDGLYTFSWAPYSGSWDGNTEYRLEYVPGTVGNPTHPGNNFWPGSQRTDSGTSSFVLDGAALQQLDTTKSYRVRLQAVRGATVLAQTATITVSITTPPAPPA